MKIKQLPESERPYEKMQMYGAEHLSNSELLAIIIKTGTKEKTSVQLAQEILSIGGKNQNNLNFLQDISIEEFRKIKGIGKVKATQLKAVGELTKRIARPINKEETKIRSSSDAGRVLMNEMRFEKREKVKLMLLNSKNILLKIIDVSYGGTNLAVIEPKDILSEPIKIGAPKILLAHNHPTGDPTPSKEDIEITKRLYNAGKLLGVELIDHIVIGNGKYKSVFIEGELR